MNDEFPLRQLTVLSLLDFIAPLLGSLTTRCCRDLIWIIDFPLVFSALFF